MVLRLLRLCFSLCPYTPIQGLSQRAGSFLVHTGLHWGALLVCLRVHRDVIRIDFRENQERELHLRNFC